MTTRFVKGLRAPFLAVLSLCWAVAQVPRASADDPSVPIGLDPGGDAMALVTMGLDYRIPEIAQRLARDGEGEIIAWDFVDGDARPYSAEASDEAGSTLIRDSDRQRWVVVRVDPSRPETLAKAISFIARTPARRVVLTIGPLPRTAWGPFRVVLKTLPHLAVTEVQCAGPAVDSTRPVWAKDLGLPNVSTAPCP